MDISKVIHLYLADDPSAWRTIVDSLCYEVSSLASRFRDPGGDDNVEQLLVDLLFPELLAPDFVSHLANTREKARKGDRPRFSPSRQRDAQDKQDKGPGSNRIYPISTMGWPDERAAFDAGDSIPASCVVKRIDSDYFEEG